MKEESFEDLLCGRLYFRADYPNGGAWALDLRGCEWADRKRLVVRYGGDSGWPNEGRTTADKATAEAWVRRYYALMFAQRRTIAQEAPDDVNITWREAGERYIQDKERSLGNDYTTVRNRRSEIRTHITPKLGAKKLSETSKRDVRELLNTLKVLKPDGRGGLEQMRAAIGTKRSLRNTLIAVWRHVLPDIEPPLLGIYLDTDPEKRALRDQIKEGDFETLLQPGSGALEPSEVSRLLVAAMHYDREMLGRENTSHWSVASRVFAIVLQICTGMRVDELVTLRWGMINLARGFILVPATKSRRLRTKDQILRAAPLQECLLPWIEWFRHLMHPDDGGPDPRGFVIRTNAKHASRRGSTRTVIARAAEVHRRAGLKTPKKATHGLRATHASWGMAASHLVTREQVKAYLGHAVAHGGSTDDYVQTMIELITPEHRRYIRHVPAPDAVEAALATFEPVAGPHWRDRRPTWTPRTKEAREGKAARQQQRLLRLRAREEPFQNDS